MIVNQGLGIGLYKTSPYRAWLRLLFFKMHAQNMHACVYACLLVYLLVKYVKICLIVKYVFKDWRRKILMSFSLACKLSRNVVQKKPTKS